MRKLVRSALVVAIVSAIGWWLAQSTAAQQNDRTVTKEMVDQWMAKLSNWGRWGKDDERGTLNLLTAARAKAAAALVKDGTHVSLSHQYLEQAADDVTSPFSREMNRVVPTSPFVGDRYSVSYHGFAHSHMDALCHNSFEGKLYNGFSRETVSERDGCTKLGISNARTGLVARGILVDIPRLKKLPYLEPSTPIYVEDLEAWERQARLKIEAGDILLLRTGRWARRAEKGPWPTGRQSAGLHASTIPWLRARDIAVMGCDSVSDVMPSGVDGVTQPIHQFTLVALGMPLLDNLDLEAVAAEAAKRNRWEFMLVAGPLVVGNGTGSPLNAIAVF